MQMNQETARAWPGFPTLCLAPGPQPYPLARQRPILKRATVGRQDQGWSIAQRIVKKIAKKIGRQTSERPNHRADQPSAMLPDRHRPAGLVPAVHRTRPTSGTSAIYPGNALPANPYPNHAEPNHAEPANPYPASPYPHDTSPHTACPANASQGQTAASREMRFFAGNVPTMLTSSWLNLPAMFLPGEPCGTWDSGLHR